ncbi:MAG: response regulator [Candidatus Rokuibacteriota bacterium]
MARILVIDDDIEIRRILEEALVAAGHEVVLAGDGAAGLRAYTDARPHVVIVDLVMPQKSGLELVVELRRADPRVKIIAISGSANLEFLAGGRDVGVERTLEKPFRLEAVIEAVADALRR